MNSKDIFVLFQKRPATYLFWASMLIYVMAMYAFYIRTEKMVVKFNETYMSDGKAAALANSICAQVQGCTKASVELEYKKPANGDASYIMSLKLEGTNPAVLDKAQAELAYGKAIPDHPWYFDEYFRKVEVLGHLIKQTSHISKVSK